MLRLPASSAKRTAVDQADRTPVHTAPDDAECRSHSACPAGLPRGSPWLTWRTKAVHDPRRHDCTRVRRHELSVPLRGAHTTIATGQLREDEDPEIPMVPRIRLAVLRSRPKPSCLSRIVRETVRAESRSADQDGTSTSRDACQTPHTSLGLVVYLLDLNIRWRSQCESSLSLIGHFVSRLTTCYRQHERHSREMTNSGSCRRHVPAE